MRERIATILLAAALVAVPGIAQSQTRTPFERQVLEALNQARAHPEILAARLMAYRARFHGRDVVIPGQREVLETEEGVAPVDEAVSFLRREAALGAIGESKVLGLSAVDHVADQSKDGSVGHDGSDGTMPWDRVARHGGGESVTEVITYGSTSPEDVIEQLVVDDGVADRGHREAVYTPELRFAGVACGTHPVYRTMCVIDLSETPNGEDVEIADARPADGRMQMSDATFRSDADADEDETETTPVQIASR